jgi:hypothetical protein
MTVEDEYDHKAKNLAMIERMDKVTESLLDLIEGGEGKPDVTDSQKGRLFAQCQSWLKLRPTLIPKGEGGRLKEIGHGLKSGSGTGSSGRGPGRPKSTSKDGRKILALVGKVRAIHERNTDADAGGDGGNPENPISPDAGIVSASGIIVPDGGGDVSPNNDVAIGGSAV